MNKNWSSHNEDSDLYYGGYGVATYVHEIGHALGLSHPGSYNAGSGDPTCATSAEFTQDNRQYTIMSYFGGYDAGTRSWTQDGLDLGWYFPSTPMVLDIAAIQATYGADYTTRAGNSTYGYNITADVAACAANGLSVYSFSQNARPIFTIWDGGSTDTLDCSGYFLNQTIDIGAGRYSSVAGLVGNVAIAHGCTIENAIGGAGNGTIIGNEVNNTIRGGLGNDTMNGGGGIDTAAFSGLRSAYTVTILGVGSVRVTGADGTDTLSDFEYLAFSDQTISATNSPPIVSVNDHSQSAGTYSQVASWISYSDPNNNPALYYQFQDNSTAATSAKFWTASGGFQAAGTTVSIAAADLNSIWVGGATAPGTETMYVRAYDGHDWSTWDPFVVNSHA